MDAKQSENVKVDLLVARAQLGEPDAFEQLVRLFHPRVAYYVHKMLLKKDLVDDIMQDVWLAVHRKLPRLRASQAFAVWLYRIARNRAVQLIRTESRYVEMNESRLASIEDEEELPNDFSDEDIRLLNIALDRIPHAQREAIVLRFMDELSYEEIATVTEQPIGTVRSRIHHAKKAIKKAMEALRHDSEG
jgi:RNA polymerase sigma-70 factor (ECF subfamily)